MITGIAGALHRGDYVDVKLRVSSLSSAYTVFQLSTVWLNQYVAYIYKNFQTGAGENIMWNAIRVLISTTYTAFIVKYLRHGRVTSERCQGDGVTVRHITGPLCYFRCITFEYINKQDAQLSQRDRAAGYISFGRKWKTGTQS